jgi:hypothetical protein
MKTIDVCLFIDFTHVGKANCGISLLLYKLGIHDGFDRFEIFAAEMTRALDPLAMHNFIAHLLISQQQTFRLQCS